MGAIVEGDNVTELRNRLREAEEESSTGRLFPLSSASEISSQISCNLCDASVDDLSHVTFVLAIPYVTKWCGM